MFLFENALLMFDMPIVYKDIPMPFSDTLEKENGESWLRARQYELILL